MMRQLKTFLIVVLAALGLPSRAHAQGLILPHPPRPGVVVRPLALKSQKVNVQVTNGAVKVEVDQLFYNPNGMPMEGTYLFPLPEGATVSNFRLTIGQEPVEGKLLTKDEARRIYESYVRRNVDPAILEYVGRNAFQARIFPVPAGGERRIQLTYSQAADFNGGIYRITYPLNAERVTGQTAGDLTVDCSIQSAQPIKAVYSPSHEVQVRRDGDQRARVTFEGKDVRADRDFVLYYSISDKAFGLNALTHRRMGEDGYAMLMLAPKHEAAAAEVQPKDIVFVFDTSGSMQGPKIDQARKALQTVLGALNRQDRFNVLRFSSDVTTFRNGVVPATKENVEAARAFVEEFRAVGGTAIDDALQAGLASVPRPDDRRGRAAFLIFMTDGLPTIGQTDVTRIMEGAQKAAPADLRLFSFGVGSDVNTLLLDRLSRDNRGAADYIAPDEDLETRIGTFYTKIADPVLSNVQIRVDGSQLKDVYPNKIPDLFAGTQLLVLGRYQGTGKVKVSLAGDLNGKPQRYEYDLTLPDRELSNNFIPKLWAGRRIGFLLEEIRLRGESKELKDEVIRLSQEHGIVTPYTSYLVEEPGAVPAAGLPILRGREAEARGERPSVLGGAVAGGGFGGRGGAVSPQDPAKPGQQAQAGQRGPVGPPGAPGASTATRSVDQRYRANTQLDARDKSVGEKKSNEAQQQNRYFQYADGFGRSTGWNSVEASKRLSELKNKERADADVEVSRAVEGRSFRLEKGVWTEQFPGKDAAGNEQGAAKPERKPVEVKYGSEAYFRLISAKPEWARILSLGKQVTFRTGKTTWVTVGEKGKDKLTDTELKGLES